MGIQQEDMIYCSNVQIQVGQLGFISTQHWACIKQAWIGGASQRLIYIYIHMIWHVRWVCLKNMDILKLHKHAISMATRWWTIFFFGAGLGVTKNLDAVWHNLFLWELSWAMEWFGMGRFPLLYSNMVTWMGHDGTFPTKWVFRCIQIMLNICLGLAIHPILPDKWLLWSISMG